MKLFTIGPVEMFDEVKNIRRHSEVPYFRTQEFSNLMLDTDKLIKKLARTDESSKVIYLTASGSAAMEATIMNCFSTADKILVINGGTFGQRFVDICKIHDIPYKEIKLRYDEELSYAHLEKFAAEKFTGLLVNIHETSTGQLYDIKLISDFCKAHNMYLVVDAISSFLCDPFDMDKFGVDVMITSSQKGICVEPGMSIVVLNEKIFNERVALSNIKSLYFDFKIYVENFKRGQTPFTPAVGICMEMNAALHMIDKLGLENHLQTIAALARDFREKIIKLPVTLPHYRMSNALTPIFFTKNIAYQVFEILKNKYEITVNPTGGELREEAFRVSHIGQLSKTDNSILIQCIEKALREIG